MPYNSNGCLCPLQLTFIFVVITSFSKAERATRGFIVDPGEYKPETVLFNKGFKGLLLISFHLFFSIQYKNKFGSNDGEEFIAIISPE